jgi:hypothetical protein
MLWKEEYMAIYIQCGEFANKSEYAICECLVNSLPDDWLVLSNVNLEGFEQREIDIVVIGNNNIFVLEIKDLDGPINCNNREWELTGKWIDSPILQVRKSTQLLVSKCKKYQVGIKFIPGWVVLAKHNELYFETEDNKENVYFFDTIVDKLLESGKKNILYEEKIEFEEKFLKIIIGKFAYFSYCEGGDKLEWVEKVNRIKEDKIINQTESEGSRKSNRVKIIIGVVSGFIGLVIGIIIGRKSDDYI